MRYSGRWMTLADDRILEFIREKGSGSPKQMKEEGKIRYTPQYIGERCHELAQRGLLQHLGNAIFVITETGEAYLDGELDTADLEDEEDGRARA